jgi:gamma-tubulin complex component 3
MQAEMVHFLRQLQAFCQLEVLECSWKALLEVTDKRDGDLDSLIAAHRTFLDRVVRKILLTGSRGREDHLLALVREALANILSFRSATDDLYAWSLGEATRLDRQRDAERGITVDEAAAAAASAEAEASREHLEGIRNRVHTCAAGFQDSLTTLCKEAGGHHDLDVRFLAIRIAFNGHYALRRGSSRPKKEKSDK